MVFLFSKSASLPLWSYLDPRFWSLSQRSRSRASLNRRLMLLDTLAVVVRNPSYLGGTLGSTAVKRDLYHGKNPWPNSSLKSIRRKLLADNLPPGFFKQDLALASAFTVIIKGLGFSDRQTAQLASALLATTVARRYASYFIGRGLHELKYAAKNGQTVERVILFNDVSNGIDSLIRHKYPLSFWKRLGRALNTNVDFLHPAKTIQDIGTAFSSELSRQQERENIEFLRKALEGLDRQRRDVRSKLDILRKYDSWQGVSSERPGKAPKQTGWRAAKQMPPKTGNAPQKKDSERLLRFLEENTVNLSDSEKARQDELRKFVGLRSKPGVLSPGELRELRQLKEKYGELAAPQLIQEIKKSAAILQRVERERSAYAADISRALDMRELKALRRMQGKLSPEKQARVDFLSKEYPRGSGRSRWK